MLSNYKLGDAQACMMARAMAQAAGSGAPSSVTQRERERGNGWRRGSPPASVHAGAGPPRRAGC